MDIAIEDIMGIIIPHIYKELQRPAVLPSGGDRTMVKNGH
jgi:hypothetical protein